MTQLNNHPVRWAEDHHIRLCGHLHHVSLHRLRPVARELHMVRARHRVLRPQRRQRVTGRAV